MTKAGKTLCFLFCLYQLAFIFSCKKQAEDEAYDTSEDSIQVTMVQKPVTAPVGNAVNGYYIGLPSNYDQTTRRYPLLLYIPGVGQLGNGSSDLPLLLNDGPAKIIREGRFPTKIKVGKGSFNFIVFTPQPRWYPSTNSINACIEYAKTHYRVDPSRIYVSGLSMGGILACDLASEIPNSIAAIVPMAGVSRDYDVKAKCKQIAGANLPVWAFHCADDNLFDFSFARKFVDDINSFNPRIKAKLTVWPNGGHDAWTRASEPDYRENGMNIYEWMLQYRR